MLVLYVIDHISPLFLLSTRFHAPFSLSCSVVERQIGGRRHLGQTVVTQDVPRHSACAGLARALLRTFFRTGNLHTAWTVHSGPVRGLLTSRGAGSLKSDDNQLTGSPS